MYIQDIRHLSADSRPKLSDNISDKHGGGKGEGVKGGVRPGRQERHLEGRKYGILKIGRYWRITKCLHNCIAERVGSLVQQLMQLT